MSTLLPRDRHSASPDESGSPRPNSRVGEDSETPHARMHGFVHAQGGPAHRSGKESNPSDLYGSSDVEDSYRRLESDMDSAPHIPDKITSYRKDDTMSRYRNQEGYAARRSDSIGDSSMVVGQTGLTMTSQSSSRAPVSVSNARDSDAARYT